MNKFILLFRGGFELVEGQSPEEFLTTMDHWKKWLSELGHDGKLAAAQPLLPAGKQVVGKGKMVVDGPFMEGKEVLGGYLICNAETYDEAVAVANGCPILDIGGTVEIREVVSMDDITQEYFRRRNDSGRKG